MKYTINLIHQDQPAAFPIIKAARNRYKSAVVCYVVSFIFLAVSAYQYYSISVLQSTHQSRLIRLKNDLYQYTSAGIVPDTRALTGLWAIRSQRRLISELVPALSARMPKGASLTKFQITGDTLNFTVKSIIPPGEDAITHTTGFLKSFKSDTFFKKHFHTCNLKKILSSKGSPDVIIFVVNAVFKGGEQ